MDDEQFHGFAEKANTSMYVVTVAAPAGGRPAGCLVGFATQCSIGPVRFLACVSKKNHTFTMITRAAFAGVHLLRDTDRSTAELFGAETGDEVDKFARCRWHPGHAGVPILAGCAAWFVGAIERSFDLGDHVGFLLDPVRVGEGTGDDVLMMADVVDLNPGHEA